MASLALRDLETNFSPVHKKELLRKKYIIFNNDTIQFDGGKQILAFRHINTRKVYIYRFIDKDYYECFALDTSWNVVEQTVHMGNVY